MFRGANLEYFPYGETWVHNKASSDQESTPYKFTGKEFDPETGFIYFGARYYDARLGRWTTVDPPLVKGEYLPKPSDFDNEHDMYWYSLNDKTNELPGMGGVFNPVNLNAYHYAGNNPVKFVDPDGEKIAVIYVGGSFTGGPGIHGSAGYVVQYGKGVEFKIQRILGANMSAGHEMGAAFLLSFYGSNDIETFIKQSWLNTTFELKGRVVGFGFTRNDEGKIRISLTAGVGKYSGMSLSVPLGSNDLTDVDRNDPIAKQIQGFFEKYFPADQVNIKENID